MFRFSWNKRLMRQNLNKLLQISKKNNCQSITKRHTLRVSRSFFSSWVIIGEDISNLPKKKKKKSIRKLKKKLQNFALK